jgi:hypothetical protein
MTRKSSDRILHFQLFKAARLICYNLIMMTPDPISDTSPEAEAVLIALLRQAPAWRKFKMVGDINATVKQFALAGIRERYPDATERQVNRHLADLLLGEELAATVYGAWDELQSS